MNGFISSDRSTSAVVSTVSVITFMPTQQPEYRDIAMPSSPISIISWMLEG